MSETSALDIASLRIAEDRVEWAVKCDAQCIKAPNRAVAEMNARGLNDRTDRVCSPHRVVSRHVIVTEWAEQ